MVTVKPTNSPTGKFYCQNGDHLVDEVFWLEQIKLGCMDCMVKLRKSINGDTGDTLRIWSVTKDGLQQVAEKKKPKLVPQDIWVCAQCCKPFPDTTHGFVNTAQGFVCKACSGVSDRVGAGKAAVKRGGEVITGRNIVLDEVKPHQIVKAGGGACSIIVAGDVGAYASLHAAGGGAKIEVYGFIHDGASIKAEGGSAVILHHGAHKYANLRVEGGGSQILDRSQQLIAKKLVKAKGPFYAWTQEVEQLRAELMSGQRSISETKKEMRRLAEEFQAETKKVSCDRCGKQVVPSPAWDPELHPARCGACWRAEGAVPKVSQEMVVEKRREMLAKTGQQFGTYRFRYQMPRVGVPWRLYYVSEDDTLYSWTNSGYVRVAMESVNPTHWAEKQFMASIATPPASIGKATPVGESDPLGRVETAKKTYDLPKGMSWVEAKTPEKAKARKRATTNRGAR